MMRKVGQTEIHSFQLLLLVSLDSTSNKEVSESKRPHPPNKPYCSEKLQ